MSLIKKNKDEAPMAPVPPPPSGANRPGKIIRSLQAREPEAPPQPEKPEGEFQETNVVVQRAAPVGRVIGQTHARPAAPTGRALPQLETLRLGPDGKPLPPPAPPPPPPPSAPESGGEPPMADETPAPPPQPQGPPIDQQIIEQAQAQAQQMLQEAQNIAQQMLMQAQQQAQQMVEQTAAQIQQAAEQAQQQGHQQGFEMGYNEGKSQGATSALEEARLYVMQARDLYVQAVRQRYMLLATCEPQVARLSVKIAERILGQEVATNPEAIVGIVSSALAGLGQREEVTIRVNPSDFEQANARRTAFEKLVEGLRKFEILADAAIESGGCAIETNLGNVDARLKTQLTTLSLAMEDEAKLQDAEIRETMQTLQPENAPPLPEPPPQQQAQPEMEMSTEVQPMPAEPIANPFENPEAPQ